MNICDFAHVHSFKMLLSILWGIFALALVYLGLTKGRKYLRIEGIALFAFTLLKLIFWDMSGFDALSRTIVLIAIGALLLVVSFFYQKIAKQQKRTDENTKTDN